MKLFNSVMFNILFVLNTLLVGLLFLPFIFSKKVTNQASKIWAKVSIFLLKFIIGVKIELIGFEKVPLGKAILAANHQSAFDTIYFLIKFENPIYILKRQLLFLPLYGLYIIRLGHIALNRSGHVKALKRLSELVLIRLESDKKIIIFPEGTRMQHKVGPIKPGIFFIQKQSKLPIYPVAISSGHVWPKNSFVKNKGRITLEVLSPIPCGLKRNDMIKKLKKSLDLAILGHKKN